MNFYNYLLSGLLGSLAIFLCSGCAPSGSDRSDSVESEESYGVVCTIAMITDIVRQVAGDCAEVIGIIGEGVDPHLYQPTRSDVVKLSSANVVFYNGLLLESKMTDVLERVATGGKPVCAVTEAILDRGNTLPKKGNGSEYTDPHVWMDVQGWSTGVEVIADTLSANDPKHAATYRANAAAYKARLEALDRYVSKAVATIPENRRVLITAHDAFQYMGRAYGLEVRGIQGISTESEAGLRDLEDLIKFIVTRDIPAVFVESSVADKNVRALIEGARAQGHVVTIGGELFSDAMGTPGTYEGTYIGMIDHNVATIVNALGGEAVGFGDK